MERNELGSGTTLTLHMTGEHRMLTGAVGSNCNSLDLIKRNLILPPAVQLRRPRRLVLAMCSRFPSWAAEPAAAHRALCGRPFPNRAAHFSPRSRARVLAERGFDSGVNLQFQMA
jgi:hypothetical protein